MSIYAMVPCWKAMVKPNQKLVLLAYADSANADGTESWPGWDELQEMTGYSKSSVASITKQLCDLGILVQTKQGRRGQRATYDVILTHDLIASKDKTLPDRVQNEPDRVQNEPDRVQPTVPLPSSTSVLSNRPQEAATPQTLMKDALVAAMGWNPKEVTSHQWGKVEVAGQMLRDIDADPNDVARRSRIYRVNFRGATITPIAIATNWADLDTPRIPVSQRELEDAATDMRRDKAFADMEAQLALGEEP